MRLDLSNPETTEKLDSNIVQDALQNDNPVDICVNCYEIGEFTDDVDHPSYDDGDEVYFCAICDALLDPYCD